jgi:hypothetical protein
MLRRCAAAAALSAFGACAAPEVPVESRLMVKLREPTADAAAVARIASSAAGVPARYVASTSLQWHAVALRCPSQAACDAALARLRSDTVNVEAVETDERKRIVTP